MSKNFSFSFGLSKTSRVSEFLCGGIKQTLLVRGHQSFLDYCGIRKAPSTLLLWYHPEKGVGAREMEGGGGIRFEVIC